MAPTAQARPLTQTIVDTLRGEIAGGQPAVGELLATEAALCRRFRVSRHTVREALRRLREAGLVGSRQGAGTTVLRRAAPALYVQSVSSVEELLQYATDARYEVDKAGMMTADAALARRLACKRGERWLRVEGFRYLADEAEPLCWTEVFVLSDYAGVGLRVGRANGPIYSWIEEMYGVHVARVDQLIRAEPMPPAITRKLGATAGNLGISVRRSYRLTNGRLVEVAFNLHAAERFSYAVSLQRRP